MEEPFVVQKVKDYLKRQGWRVFSKVEPKDICGQKIIPDVVAQKGESGDILCVEAKGSLPLHNLMQGIGQAIAYTYYGANIICFAAPSDVEEESLRLVKPITLAKNGKMGLFIVKNDGSVDLKINYKRFDRLTGIRVTTITEKLMYVADLKVKEIGQILNFAYKNRGNYESSTEFMKLIMEYAKEVLPGREFKTEFNKKKMLNNFFITFNHLDLWDHNYHLNKRGDGLRLLFNSNFDEFKDKIGFIILTEGNWLGLINILYDLSQNKYKSMDEYYKELVKEMINKNFQKPTENIEGLSKKMSDRYFRFLKTLDFVESDRKNNRYLIKWNNVIRVLRTGL
jgi:hypothetical protein